MKNYCLQWDSNPVPSSYEANALSILLLDLISIGDLKVDRVLSGFVIKIYHFVDVEKSFVEYYILLTLLQSANA